MGDRFLGTVMLASGELPVSAIPERRRFTWRRLCAAMGQAGSASLASALLSALAAKVIAASGGPSAIALYASLQQARQAGLVIATANGQTALVQGASAQQGEAQREFVRTAAWIFSGLTALVGVLFWSAPLLPHGSIPAQILASIPGSSQMLRAMAGPVAVSAIFVFLSGLLTVLGRVGVLASLQVISAGALAGCILHFSRSASGALDFRTLAGSMTAAGGLVVVIGCLALFRDRNTWGGWIVGPGKLWSWVAARHYFSISGGMLVTGLLSSSMLLMVRGRVGHLAGSTAVGQFDAAWGISMNQTALVLSSMQTYCLPLLSGINTNQQRSREVSRLVMAAAGVGAVAVILIAIVKPWLLSTLYSSAFAPAGRVLRWTLMGDFCKITSWVLALSLLATGDWKAFFAADVAAYGAFGLSHMFLTRWLDPAAAGGAAFLCMYAIHLLVCLGCLWARHGFRPSRGAGLLWSGLALLVSLSSWAAWDD